MSDFHMSNPLLSWKCNTARVVRYWLVPESFPLKKQAAYYIFAVILMMHYYIQKTLFTIHNPFILGYTGYLALDYNLDPDGELYKLTK